MKTAAEIPSQAEALETLRKLIKHINIAMLTTVAADGSLRSRPMATQQADLDGTLWFFTADDAPKVDEISEDHHVGLCYAAPNKQQYVSVTGRARVLWDREKIGELWTPAATLWFPGGPDDPRLALLRVEVVAAEYWDAPSSKMIYLWGAAKMALTGKAPDIIGGHAKVSL